MARPAPVNVHPIHAPIAMADSIHFRYSLLMKPVSAPMPARGPFVTRLLKIALLPLAMALGHHACWASEASAAALRVLLGTTIVSQPATPPSAPSAADSPTRRTISVLRGESLDRLIRRAMPGMPLHPDFLRQAFVIANPQVFPKGAPHAMRTGTTLQVPTTDELRMLLMSQYPETASLFQVVETTKASDPEPVHARRQWVRYP